jgi:hypothetical protein
MLHGTPQNPYVELWFLDQTNAFGFHQCVQAVPDLELICEVMLMAEVRSLVCSERYSSVSLSSYLLFFFYSGLFSFFLLFPMAGIH